MSEVKFYRCAHCGNIIVVVEDGKVTPQCCGEKMQLLEAGTTDAATEKHIPVVHRANGLVEVSVGEVAHPMLEEHYIQWIALVAQDRLEIHNLHPEDEPKTTFADAEGAISVYEYCNLHGLWKAEA